MTKKRPKDVSPDVRLIVNWANGTIGTSDHVDVRDPRIREPNSDGEKSNFWKDTEVKLAKTEMDIHFQKVKVSNKNLLIATDSNNVVCVQAPWDQPWLLGRSGVLVKSIVIMTEASDMVTKPDVGYVTSPKNAAIKRWSKNGNVEVLAKKKVKKLKVTLAMTTGIPTLSDFCYRSSCWIHGMEPMLCHLRIRKANSKASPLSRDEWEEKKSQRR